jgi:hypothetical protein
MEFPPRDKDGRKTVLFLVNSGTSKSGPLLVSITRSEEIRKQVVGPPIGSGRGFITGYELKVNGPSQSRILFIPFRRPEYSDMKNALLDFLEGA